MVEFSVFEFILLFIIVSFFECVFPSFLNMFLAKKSKYDCSKCRNWDCMIHHCTRKREELKK